MRTFAKLTILLVAAIATACNVTQDNNQSLDYDTLEVNFSATLSGATWEADHVIGVVATCTREGETDVAMNTASISAFSPVSNLETSILASKSEEDKIMAQKGDHNFKFYVFTPYSGGEEKNPSFEYYGTKYNPVPPAWRDTPCITKVSS